MTDVLPPAVARTPTDDAPFLVELAHRSHVVITAHQDRGGAYPASPTFSAYAGYAWLRDGAFTAEGVSRYGDVASADRFHDWSSGVLRARTSDVAALVAAKGRGESLRAEQMLPTRFRLDGRDGTDPWWDFQTDGFGTWLWSVGTHAGRHGLDLQRWCSGVEVAVDYLTAFWAEPCYDWWEEHVEHRHVSTLGAIYGGLSSIVTANILDSDRQRRAAETAEQIKDLVLRDGVRDGHLTKWLGTAAVDGSLPACIVPFGLVAVDTKVAATTLGRVQAALDVSGGVHRYTDDVFYGGGQWPLLSALLGWNRAIAGDSASALAYLRWIAHQQTPHGELPEQVATHLLAPRHQGEWVERWGPVATPLLWSHGMYLILADELGLLDRAERVR